MNDEHDVLSRLVDYHDHISAPPVSTADDIRRGRRRVRRNRGLLAGGVGVGLASVVAAVSLIAGGEPSSDRVQPAGSPADAPGLTTPLVLPDSPVEVREVGFRVEPGSGFSPAHAWGLAPGHQSTTVELAGRTFFVRVHYPGTERPDWRLNLGGHVVEGVRVHGVAGTYVEQFGKAASGGSIDFSAGACDSPPRGCEFWQAELMWEFAPGSWASVYASTGEAPPEQDVMRPVFLQVAESLRSGGGLTTHLPFRVGTDLGPLPPPGEAGAGLAPVDHPPGASGWLISFYGEPTLQLSVDDSSCRPGAEESLETAEPFTYRGHPGCVLLYDGEASGVALRVDGVDRVLSNPWGRYRDGLTAERISDLKEWLADLTVAPLDDPSAWFDLASALGG